MLLQALALASLALGSSPPHPDSASESLVRVEGAQVTVTLALQSTSVFEVLDVDANGDGLLDGGELSARVDELAAYTLAHYRLRADSLGDPSFGRGLAGRLVPGSARVTAPDFLFGGDQRVELELVFEDRAPLADLLVEMDLFLETSPRHFDVCRVIFSEGGVERTSSEALLTAARPASYFRRDDAGHPRALRLFGRLGVDHILSGYDHLAFLAVLLVGAASLRALLGVVTAFTVAHSVTLGLAALDVVAPPAQVVELAIALSIAYVAAENLLRGPGRRLWPEAFVFGLVHGLGFAGFLGDFLQFETSPVRALIGFNLGVELGQLAVVLPAALVLLALRRRGPDAAPAGSGTPRPLASRGLRLATSATVGLLALYWFFERARFAG